MEFEELVWLPPYCRKKLDVNIAAEGSDAFGLGSNGRGDEGGRMPRAGLN